VCSPAAAGPLLLLLLSRDFSPPIKHHDPHTEEMPGKLKPQIVKVPSTKKNNQRKTKRVEQCREGNDHAFFSIYGTTSMVSHLVGPQEVPRSVLWAAPRTISRDPIVLKSPNGINERALLKYRLYTRADPSDLLLPPAIACSVIQCKEVASEEATKVKGRTCEGTSSISRFCWASYFHVSPRQRGLPGGLQGFKLNN